MTNDDQSLTLFLDTEWADDDGRELVSLALVPGGPYGLFTGSEAGPFYAERNPLPTPNAYVRNIVYPLLDRGAHAKSDDQFSRDLNAYIARAHRQHSGQPPVIIATHVNDFELLRHMLSITCQTPVYRTELRFAESLIDLIRTTFARNPDLSRRRHHALVDAQVLQSVYRDWSRIGRPS
ncbi:hypothetical protein [Dyella sp. Tek66A03]|uniref:hypothetical protein n=1 Tax=Dyella sp. Tek66A03 TaxID=3458298 RepID=UPI00403E4733